MKQPTLQIKPLKIDKATKKMSRMIQKLTEHLFKQGEVPPGFINIRKKDIRDNFKFTATKKTLSKDTIETPVIECSFSERFKKYES